VTGYFLGTVDFDPGPGVCERTTRDYDLPSISQWSGTFLAKYNSNGEFQWVQVWDGLGFSDIQLSDTGDIGLCSSSLSRTDLDPGPDVFQLSSQASENMMAMRLGQSGNFKWAKSWGGPSHCCTGSRNSCTGLAFDQADNMVLTGIFAGDVDFDPGPENLSVAVPEVGSGFLSRLDPNGNLVDVTTWPTESGVDFQGIQVDRTSGTIDIYGSFMGTMDFDPGPGTKEVKSVNSLGGTWFVMRLNPDKSLANYTLVDLFNQPGGSLDLENKIVDLGLLSSGNPVIIGTSRYSLDFVTGNRHEKVVQPTEPYYGNNIYLAKLPI
jgi:hypothetical protein